ncbi:MAG: hypothetical protein CMN85_09015 [Spongiibacteraceae bacterium]|nr:hypothetical protein [Spongiibacteraceae bacterium]|tara:strand:+ start:409 stop:576 length:168 start_codon:yes stop_codon:yes gene_type:complete
MNIENFILTTTLSLIAGLVLGYFGKSIITNLSAIVGWIYNTPRRLVPYKKNADSE